MERDEPTITTLWLEEHHSYLSATESLRFATKKHRLSKAQLESLNIFLKKNRLSWSSLIHLAWGILLNRLSTSNSVYYGSANLISAKKDTLALQEPLAVNKCLLNKTITLKTLLSKQEALKKKKSTALRYLLLFNASIKKNKTAENITINQYPLILNVDKKNPALWVIFYNEAIFSPTGITTIINTLTVILQEIQKGLHQRAATLNILTAEDKHTVLHTWNNPDYGYHFPSLQGCFHDLVSHQATIHSKKIAVSHLNTHINYKELDEASTRLALHLTIDKHVTQGDCIGVFMDRTPTWIVAMLAIFKAGAIYVPINPKFSAERINYVIEDCGAKYILASDAKQLPTQYHTKSIVIDHRWNNQTVKPTTKQRLPCIDPESIAYIVYTSGTTGQPKGVMIKHKSLVNLVVWYQGCFKITHEDRASQFASQGFDSHLCEIIPFLASGGSVHLVDDTIKLTPSLFFNWLEKHKITVADIPTSYAQILFTLTWPTEVSLRIMKIGGETITHYPTQVLPFDVWNGYGPTEITVEATYFKLNTANETRLASMHQQTPPIGKPIINYQLYIVDNNMQLLPIGIVGELLIGGIGVSAGYLHRDELTREKFINNPFINNTQEKLYRTGDLARWLPDGNLEFIGRIDNQVKIRGYRIELGDIENALSQHPDVSEVVVLLKENNYYDKSLVAYVVPNLDKERYLYQERCLLSLDNTQYIEAITEDISKGGTTLSGIQHPIPVGSRIYLRLKMPGFSDPKPLIGRLIWQIDQRCGLAFDMPKDEMKNIAQSIDFYLSTHNVMEMVLNASAKRSLRKALRKKLPDYMIPPTLITLLQLPLTFSGKVDKKNLPQPQDYDQIINNEFIAAKTITEKRLASIWCQLLHKNQISMTDNFFDLGGSSLTAAALSVKILNEFNIPIPAKILFDLAFVPIIAEYIDTKGSHYLQQSVLHDEITRDTILPENIIPTKNISSTAMNPQNILLTGAGGFLGIYLLRELLVNTQAKIYCLIRKGDFETAAKRLLSTINKFNLGNDISLSNRRIILIDSDISYDHFGLATEQYNNLLDKIDLIYHCGAQVNMMTAYNKLRNSNVVGTLEIIKFATQHFDKPIHYISTLSAGYCKDEDNRLAEVFPTDTYVDLFGGYAVSKWVSERLLTEAKNRGLPVSIYRAGYISGQTNSGIMNFNDSLFMLIKGCIQLGYAPDMEENIAILPVDFVSNAITKISLANPCTSLVYHVEHPIGILWPDLVKWINDYGYRINLIPMQIWQEKLISVGNENALFPLLPFYLSLPQHYQSPAVNTANTSHALEKTGLLPYPSIDDRLLTVYFDYMRETEFLPTLTTT